MMTHRAGDYVYHFCGPRCLTRWQARLERKSHARSRHEVKSAVPERTYTLSQLAQAAGTTIHLVNNYLTEDLIACCVQTASGYRRFDETALARLRFIRAGRIAGFGIKDLKPLLQALDRQDAADIAHRLADLKAAVDEAAKRLGAFESIAEQLAEAPRVDPA
jgi:mercuric resistance transcriptional repressor protein MerD